MALNPTSIRQALLGVGESQASIAERLRVTRQHVNNVVTGQKATPRTRRAVAKALGMTYLQVWGEADPEADDPPSMEGSPPSADMSTGGRQGAA